MIPQAVQHDRWATLFAAAGLALEHIADDRQAWAASLRAKLVGATAQGLGA